MSDLPFPVYSFPLCDGSGHLLSWPAGAMDNIAWLLVSDNREAVAVDIPDSGRLIQVLRSRQLTLRAVWLTHTHHDHVNGIREIHPLTGCHILAPHGKDLGVSVQPLQDGDAVEHAGFRAEVLDTSGHSPHDLSFVLPELELCFCGDTVFDGGVGRMFTGPAERYWASQCKLRALPESFSLCVGHDYAADNYAFASSVLPGDPDIASRAQSIRNTEGFRFPVTVADQKTSNLFWRADDPELSRALNMDGAAPTEVFAALREAKDRF